MENKKTHFYFVPNLSAAFNTVNHSILLKSNEKLLQHKNATLKWILSYLKHKTFSVHIDEFLSDIKTTNLSVPQGGKLGPNLFDCYVSTLMETIPETKNIVARYADDHVSINSFTSVNIDTFSTLSSDIACTQGWMDKNKLNMTSNKPDS